MSTSKLNKKIIKNARNRELLYAEAQEKAISEQRKALKNKQKHFDNVNSMFYSLSHSKPTDYKTLYYKTLSRNHILDLSDTGPGSPLMLLSPTIRNSIVESSQGPEFEKKDLNHVMKHIKNNKTTDRGLRLSLNQLKNITKKDRDTLTSISILKFTIKRHLEESYLFENAIVNTYSEGDYVVKFWGPLIEKAFKKSSIIPHWGDTIPGSLLSIGVKMKMDLRLIAIDSSKLQDHGYGEIAKKCSTQKYFKDKRKTVIASKALLNSLINMNTIDQEKETVYIPYLIVMGFEMHFCIVFLKASNFYITKKVKTITLPSNLNNFAEESTELANSLLDLVALCEAIKKQACRGKKRKSINNCIGDTTLKQKKYNTSKTVWDDVKDDELEEEEEDDNEEEEEDDDDEEEEDDDEEEEEEEEDDNDDEDDSD